MNRGDLESKLVASWEPAWVSLYSTREDVDCGAIAKSLGGGGHKGAAGFICDELPWTKA